MRKPYGTNSLSQLFFANNFNAGSKTATDDHRQVLRVTIDGYTGHEEFLNGTNPREKHSAPAHSRPNL